MATVRPARTFYIAEHEYSCWWVPGSGLVPVYADDGYLRIGKDSAGTLVASAAIKFNALQPGWIADGPISEVTPVLRLFILKRHKANSGGSTIRFTLLNETWDTTYTAAQMDAIGSSGYSDGLDIPPAYGWWSVAVTVAGAASAMRAYGVKLTISGSAGQELYILQEPTPRLHCHYQYALGWDEESDAEERSVLSAAASRALQRKSGSWEVAATIESADVLPVVSDIPLSLRAGMKSSLAYRSVEWPISWAAPKASRGSLAINTVGLDLTGYRGLPISLLSRYVPPSGKTEVVAGARALLDEVESYLDGTSDLSMTDLLDSAFKKKIADLDDVLGLDTVNWLDEYAVVVLHDLLLGAGGLRYNEVLYNDFVWLARRYGPVWPKITIAAVDLKDKTVEDVVAAVASRYCLAVSRTGNGMISVWSPAAYRPSMKVWTLDLNDPRVVSCKRLTADSWKQYTKVTAVSEYGYGATAYPLEHPPYGMDLTDKVYAFGRVLGSDFDDYDEARQGLVHMAAQRLLSRSHLLQVVLGPEGCQIEPGDQVVVTSSEYEYDETPFLVLVATGDKGAGTEELQLIHYPNNWGLHSLFQTTELKGVWRWWDWEADAVSMKNFAHTGIAGDFTTSDTFDRLFVLSEGAALGGGVVKAPTTGVGFAPYTNGSNLVDMMVVTTGDPIGMVDGGGMEDDNYYWIWQWRKDYGLVHEAVCVGIYRKKVPDTKAYEACFFIGHTLDYTAIPIVWKTGSPIYARPGVGTSWTGSAHNSTDSHAVAVIWEDDTNVRFIVDGVEVGKIPVSWSGTWEFYARSVISDDDAGWEAYIGPIRWLHRTSGSWDIEKEVYKKNGIDPFYR